MPEWPCRLHPADVFVRRDSHLPAITFHALFPAAARGFAVEVLLFGHQLSHQPRFTGQEAALVDVWTQLVMPSAVVR